MSKLARQFNSNSLIVRCVLALAFLMGLNGLASVSFSQEKIQYNRDIRPILSNNCFFCHGFDKANQKANLRLDSFDDAVDAGAIEPGSAAESELVRRILSDDPTETMPPADSAYALTAEQKKLIVRWIDQGATYQEHWAYRPLDRPVTPDNGSRQPIDAFLRQQWDRQKIQPVKLANPRALIRRLSFDLRGIPPTFEEVTAFERDPSDQAWQKLIREWTSSIEHAEHQGLWWLDLVRWADSTGMVSDEPIATGLYRSYVIQAFQNNMPFDQFTREQLAGDLLPNRNNRTLIASGYNRLVKTNSEAGVIEQEALHALKGEHVRALGTVWLAATTGCAECHDHKYDPLSARDYYSMAAFFDDLIEIGVYDPGDRRVPIRYIYDTNFYSRSNRREDSFTTIDDQLAQKIATLRKQLYEAPVDAQQLTNWEASILKRSNDQPKFADFAWMPAKLPPAKTSRGHYQQTEAGRLVVANENELVSHMAGEVMTGFIDSKLLPPTKHRYVYSDIQIEPDNPPQAIAVQIIHGAYQRVGWHNEYYTTYYWGDQAAAKQLQSVQPKPEPNRIVHMGPIPPQKNREILRLKIPGNKIVKSPHEPVGMAWIQIGGSVTWGDSGYRLRGRDTLVAMLAESTLRYWWELPWNRDDREHRMRMVLKSIKTPAKSRRQIHNQVIRFAFAETQHPEIVDQLRDLYRNLCALRRQAKHTALISQVGPQRTTRIRNRGNFMDQSGPVVSPAIPEFLGTLKLDRQANRLDLARWLTSPDNPLTPRVLVNRLWYQFYGRGLCDTLEDFGNQGDWPSHPELLDWLAIEFVESGWDVRHIVRILVSAEAYKLSSVAPPSLTAADPSNRLHARQSRHRHLAEDIRDSALKVAGLLKQTDVIPVASFYPYQPNNYWDKSNKIMFGSRYQRWDTSAGESQYQRSIYTYWKRQNPHASLLAFDAPTRQECTAKRNRTNTPGQALALLNDPIYVEASRALAQRVLTNEGSQTPESRIDLLFQYALQRSPSSAERLEILKVLQRWTEHYQQNPEQATEMLNIGQHPIEDSISSTRLAAWTAACRVILNLHEFITRS